MLMMKQKRTAIRTLRGWTISVLHEAGAIRECEEHGWMMDRGDPDAREASPSPVGIRRPTCRQRKRSPQSRTCSARSGIPARSACPPTRSSGCDDSTADLYNPRMAPPDPEQGVPTAFTQEGEVQRLDGGSFPMTPAAKGESVGTQAAQAVFGGLQS